MNVNSMITIRYAKMDTWLMGKTKPIQTQLKPKQTQFKPKQTQSKPIYVGYGCQETCEKTTKYENKKVDSKPVE